jgi:hypothetical protein
MLECIASSPWLAASACLCAFTAAAPAAVVRLWLVAGRGWLLVGCLLPIHSSPPPQPPRTDAQAAVRCCATVSRQPSIAS